MRFELKPARSGNRRLWVYRTRVLTGTSQHNATSFAKAVSLSFGRYLSSKRQKHLAEDFHVLKCSYLRQEGYGPAGLAPRAAAIVSALDASGLRLFDAEGEELWRTALCPPNASRVVLVQLRETAASPAVRPARRARQVKISLNATGRWRKVGAAGNRVRGLRVAVLHSESHLCCLGCGVVMMSWDQLLSHAETYVRLFDLERVDPNWRKEFWASEAASPTVLCTEHPSADALQQRQACAKMALDKLRANEQWEYTEGNLYKERLARWAEAITISEVALGWDTETATPSESPTQPDVPDMEALAYEAAEVLNAAEPAGSLCRALVPVCVQISGRGTRVRRAFERAEGGRPDILETTRWRLWDSSGDPGIPADVCVLTGVIPPEETVGGLEEMAAESYERVRLLMDALYLLDRLYAALAGGRCLRLVLFGHNAARFDNVLLLAALRRARGPELYRCHFFRGAVQRIVYSPLPGCGHRGCRHCEVVFCDTCQVFPAPLAQLSKELSLSGGGKLDLDARACSEVWMRESAWRAGPELVRGNSGDALRACLERYPDRFPVRGPPPEEDAFYHILVYAVRDAVAVLELAEKQMTYLEAILNEVRRARGPREGDESEWVSIPLGGINTISGFSYLCTNAMLFPDVIVIPQGARAADINACMIGGHTEIHVQGFLLHNEGPMLGKGPLRQLDIDGMYCNIQRAKIFPAGRPEAMTRARADAVNAWLETAPRDATLEDSPCGMVFGTFEVRLPRDERSWPAVGVLGVKMRVDYSSDGVNNQVWCNMPRRQRMTLLHALTFHRRGFRARLVSPDSVSWGTCFPDGVCSPFLAAMDLYLAGKARSKKEGRKAMTMVYKLVANANFGQMAMQSTRPTVFEVEEEDYPAKVAQREKRGDFELLDVTEVAPHVLMVRVRPRVVMHARPHQWGTMILAGAHSEFSDFAARFDPLLGLVPPRDRPLGITHGDTDSIFVPESLALGCVGPDWWTTGKGIPQVGGSPRLSVTLDEKEPFGKGFHVVISKKKENILLSLEGRKEFVVAKGMALKDLQPQHFRDVWGEAGRSESLSRSTLRKTLSDATITETTLTRRMRLIPVIMGEKRLSRRLRPRAPGDPFASGFSDAAPLLYTDLTSLLDVVRGFRPGYVLRRVVFFNAQPLDFEDDGDGEMGDRPPQLRCCPLAKDLVEVRWPKTLRPYFPGTVEANYRVDLDRMQEARATMLVCRTNACRGNRRPHPPAAWAN